MTEEWPLLRRLPAVDAVMAVAAVADLVARFGHVMVRDEVRRRLSDLRAEVTSGKIDTEILGARLAGLADDVRGRLEEQGRDPYRRVLNASGILIHTNLGRAPLSRRAAEAISRTAVHGVALEYDLEAGERGSRLHPLRKALERMFPGRSGLAVTNNAAAVLLALDTVARGREVVISRGELVEIGGGFRVPDILVLSGARLVEVGTTNRTRESDYSGALGEHTGAILRVHPSNFRQVGFTESVPARRLAALARQAGVPFIVDQGSGNLHELGPFGLGDEVSVASVLEEGADLVTFSGDKLLGGPQAGIIVGESALVEKLARNALARALRPDKLILAALIATLADHESGRAFEEIPVLRRLTLPPAAIRGRAETLCARLVEGGIDPARLEVSEGTSRSGGGSSPDGALPTFLVRVDPGGPGEAELASRLRLGEPAVVGRLAEGRLVLDLRTIDAEEDELLAETLLRALLRLRR